MSLRGSVDHLSADGASGWIFDTVEGRPLVVQALLDGRIVGEALAELYRADLAAAGLGDGRCGFEIVFSTPVEPTALPFLAIKPQGGDVELPRTNLTGFGDYFRSLFAHAPGAGRPRSVFGGLWTDRTDAARLLQGRVASGATPAELAAPLRTLIFEGYALLRGALAPAGFGPAELDLLDSLEAGPPLDPEADGAARRLLEGLPAMLFRDAVVRVARAALDDNPVAYRTVLSRGRAGSFGQPSAAEALTSPAECLALVTCAGSGPVLLDVIRGSHELPEFTRAGQSRWLTAGAGAGIELALGEALSVAQVEIGPQDVALIGPGTLYRLRTPDGATGLTTWCAPARVSPVAILAAGAGTFSVRHGSGAMVRV